MTICCGLNSQSPSRNMTAYFKLQFARLVRKLSYFGLHPIIGGLLLLLVFMGLSVYIFSKTSFAPYAYSLIALYFASKLSEIKRNDFLKMCFGNKRHKTIRVLENLIVVLPFVIYLMYERQFYPVVGLIATVVLLALLNFKTTYTFAIPTPFYKKPFEFTVGFRNTFFLFLMAYGLAIIAIVVDNFNLGIAALMLVFLTVLCYYTKPEQAYFVWSYSLTPAKFLIEKIQTAFVFSFYLCVPILVSLGIFYFENIHIVLIFALLGYVYLVMMILTKYTAYPNEINLVQGILICMTFVFPLLFIAVVPFFANQSVNKLKEFLR